MCVSDPFMLHFEIDLDDKVAEELSGCKTCQKEEVKACYRLMSFFLDTVKVSKGAKIRSRFNQVPHLTQDTNGNVTNSQLDTTNKSQEVSPSLFITAVFVPCVL